MKQQPSSMIWPKHSVQNRIQLARELPHQLPGQTQLQHRQIIERQHYEHFSDSIHSSRQRQLEEQEVRKFQISQISEQHIDQYAATQNTKNFS